MANSLEGKAAPAAGGDRKRWTTKQWYEHVGAWETPEGHISFGSVMALGAMLIQFQRAHQPAQEQASAPDIMPNTRTLQFLTDVVSAAGLLSYGRTDKKLAARISSCAYEIREELFAVSMQWQTEEQQRASIGSIEDYNEFNRLLEDLESAKIDAYACGNDFGSGNKHQAAYENLVAYIDKWSSQRAASTVVRAQSEESAAARDVLAERRRQVEQEGRALEEDDQMIDGQMATVAGYYALASGHPHNRNIGRGRLPDFWPWTAEWWKPRDARSNLVRAGALMLAEIERLDRAAIRAAQEGHK